MLKEAEDMCSKFTRVGCSSFLAPLNQVFRLIRVVYDNCVAGLLCTNQGLVDTL